MAAVVGESNGEIDMNGTKRNKIIYWTLTILVLLPTAGSGFPELFYQWPTRDSSNGSRSGIPTPLSAHGFVLSLAWDKGIKDRLAIHSIADEVNSTMKILVLGASGLVGKNVLAQALAHPAITSVVAPTRRPLVPHPKLTNPVSDRLELLLPDGVARGIDAVVCALGTTLGKAGSKEAFREVDYVLPLAFARSAHEQGSETFVLVSASVASVNSSFFYPRIKGELERDIERVGFKSLTIIRPSLIGGKREESRFAEGIALRLVSVFAPILPNRFHLNPAPIIAAAAVNAVTTAEPGRHFRDSGSLV